MTALEYVYEHMNFRSNKAMLSTSNPADDGTLTSSSWSWHCSDPARKIYAYQAMIRTHCLAYFFTPNENCSFFLDDTTWHVCTTQTSIDMLRIILTPCFKNGLACLMQKNSWKWIFLESDFWIDNAISFCYFIIWIGPLCMTFNFLNPFFKKGIGPLFFSWKPLNYWLFLERDFWFFIVICFWYFLVIGIGLLCMTHLQL
jgi:hypothetical protein